VIVGLIGIRISETSDSLDFLAKGDAVAALFVAVIVIVVSVQLGKRAVAG